MKFLFWKWNENVNFNFRVKIFDSKFIFEFKFNFQINAQRMNSWKRLYQTLWRLDFTKDFDHIKIKMTNHEEPNHLQLLNKNGKRKLYQHWKIRFNFASSSMCHRYSDLIVANKLQQRFLPHLFNIFRPTGQINQNRPPLILQLDSGFKNFGLQYQVGKILCKPTAQSGFKCHSLFHFDTFEKAGGM